MGRLLLAASPITGHVTPLLRIGAGLRAGGHDVAVLTGRDYADMCAAHGLDHVVLPDGAGPMPSAVVRGNTSGLAGLMSRWRQGRVDMRSVFIDPMAAQFEALAGVLAQQAFDAVLCDIAFTGVLPLLLRPEARPAVLACGVGPLTLSSRDVPPFGMGWRPRPGTDYRAMTQVVHHVLFRSLHRSLNKSLRRLGAGESPVFVTDWPLLADRLLQFTVAGFEYPRSDLPPSVVFTGPALGPVGAARCGAARRGDESVAVVHVTQGTWDNGDLGQLVRPTLDALSGCDDMVVVATTGRAGCRTVEGAIPRNAWVTDFVDYAQVLPHVDVMITNGGYGGVQLALAHGIPLVVAGQTADKHEVAARVAHFGAGIDLGRSAPTADAIAAAVREVLSCSDYRDAAHCLGRQLRAGDAAAAIAEVVDTLPRRSAMQ